MWASEHRAARRSVGVLTGVGAALLLGCCAVVSLTATVASAAVSVASTVVVTGVKVTGKAVGAAVDAVSDDAPAPAAAE